MVGKWWDGATYNGDDVSMVILASVAFFFPLHGCGFDAKNVVEGGEGARICGAPRVIMERGLEWWTGPSKRLGEFLYEPAEGTMA